MDPRKATPRLANILTRAQIRFFRNKGDQSKSGWVLVSLRELKAGVIREGVRACEQRDVFALGEGGPAVGGCRRVAGWWVLSSQARGRGLGGLHVGLWPLRDPDCVQSGSLSGEGMRSLGRRVGLELGD